MSKPTPPPVHPERDHEPLAATLQRMAGELATHTPPPAVRSAMLARWPRGVLSGAPVLADGGGRFGWAPWTTAALCGLLLVVGALLFLRAPGGADTKRWVGTAAAGAGGFVPVAAAERWPTAAGRSAPAWLVQAELPRERLAEWGLPFDPSRAADAVRAELLMRANGEVLAVRVLAEPPLR